MKNWVQLCIISILCCLETCVGAENFHFHRHYHGQPPLDDPETNPYRLRDTTNGAALQAYYMVFIVRIVEVCPAGMFDWNGGCYPCSTFCRTNGKCNKFTGICDGGCKAGASYDEDPRCLTVCPSGTWGPECLRLCGHCKYGTCHPTNGLCYQKETASWEGKGYGVSQNRYQLFVKKYVWGNGVTPFCNAFFFGFRCDYRKGCKNMYHGRRCLRSCLCMENKRKGKLDNDCAGNGVCKWNSGCYPKYGPRISVGEDFNRCNMFKPCKKRNGQQWYYTAAKDHNQKRCARVCGKCLKEVCQLFNGFCVFGCESGYEGRYCRSKQFTNFFEQDEIKEIYLLQKDREEGPLVTVSGLVFMILFCLIMLLLPVFVSILAMCLERHKVKHDRVYKIYATTEAQDLED